MDEFDVELERMGFEGNPVGVGSRTESVQDSSQSQKLMIDESEGDKSASETTIAPAITTYNEIENVEDALGLVE